MIRWRAFCSYDGTDFAGWQSQPAGNAVQDVIEKAISTATGQVIRVHAASRTDAGVHALAQGIHFDTDWKHSAEALGKAVGNHLPETIRIHGLKQAEPGFHARYSAAGKRYVYYFSTSPATPFTVRYRWHLNTSSFDPDRIRKILPCFAGTHDFRAFAGKVVEEETPEKKLLQPVLRDEGEGNWCLEVEGNGFLYRMVRCIVGTLIRVATGKLPPERIPQLLLEASRSSEIHTAPPRGLFLEKVLYPSPQLSDTPAAP